MPQALKNYLLCIALTLLLCGLFLGLLTLSYSYGGETLYRNTRAALETIQKEGDYPIYFFEAFPERYRLPAQGDNYSDSVILERAGFRPQSALLDALDMQKYARYWHGYVALLRPLLCLMSYENIRLLMMALFSLLCGVSLLQLYRQFGSLLALCFGLSLMILQGFIIPSSPQYFVCFAIALAAMNLVLCYAPKKTLHTRSVLLFFTLIGALTSFLDLLTVPLITFGLPLLMLLAIEAKAQRQSSPLLRGTQAALAWLIGFGLNWALKWVLASSLLEYDVLTEAKAQALFRMAQQEGLGSSQIGAIVINLNNLLHFVGIGYLAFCLLLLILALIRGKIRSKAFFLTHCLLMIAPYVWFAVLSNHSQIHAWFTFRTQIITLLGLPLLALSLVDFQQEQLCIWKKR